jgi:hypothetical protein
MALLAVDFYVDQRGIRTPIAGVAVLSILLALLGGYYYVFLNWQQGTWAYWLFNVGFVLMGLFILMAMVAVILGVPERFSDGESVPPIRRNGKTKPKATPEAGKATP